MRSYGTACSHSYQYEGCKHPLLHVSSMCIHSIGCMKEVHVYECIMYVTVVSMVLLAFLLLLVRQQSVG